MNLDGILNNTLVFDIETSAEYSDGREVNINSEDYVSLAQCKWVGIYSFKDNKEYYLEVKKEREKICELLNNHDTFISFNGEEFDYPILVNNGLVESHKWVRHVDCMKILGSSKFLDKHGQKFKNRGELMGYSFKNNSLQCMAETMGLEYQKSTIDYKIFKKDSYTDEEKKEIITYLRNDVLATKGLFDKLYDYWKPFTDIIGWKDVANLSWIRSSIASLTYKSACHSIGVEPTYSDSKEKVKEEMGGNVLKPKYEEARDVFYVDYSSLYPHIFCMFNLFAEVDKHTENAWHGNDLFKVKGYYDVSYKHPLAKAVEKKLEERIRLKQTDPNNPMVHAIKIFVNSLYGTVRSPIFEQVHTPNSGWDCCWLGQQLQQFVVSELEKVGYDITYGDSITKDTKILLEDNNYVAIEDLWNKNKNDCFSLRNKQFKKWDNKNVLSCNNNLKNVFVKPKEIIRHKCNKKIYELELTNQEKISITEDHSLIFLDENFKYKNFSVQDIFDKKIKYVLFNRQIPIKKSVSRNYQKEIYNLMGMCIANGNVEKYRILFSFEHLHEYIKNIVSKIKMPFKLIYRNKKSDFSISQSELVKIFNDSNLSGTSKTKRIPEWIYYEKEENICEFLKGCMTGDGTVSMRQNSPIIRYTSINEDLINDLQKLFLQVGIATSIIKESKPNNYNKKCSNTYSCHLAILDREIYKRKIGFSCKTKEDRIKNRTFTQYVNAKKQDCSKEKIKKENYIAKKCDNLDFGFVLRRVKSIKEINYTDYVYDISIPNYEKFYANNILVHNTDSIFVRCITEEHKSKKFLLTQLGMIIQKIFDNVPFPVETFDINIEKYIDYILFPFSEEPIVDEETRQILNKEITEDYIEKEEAGKKVIVEKETGKVVKRGRSWVKEYAGKKKNYVYLYKKDGESQIEIVGLPLKKDNATPLGYKIYEEILKPKILEQGHAKFTQEFIDESINNCLKDKEIMKLCAVEYKVKKFDTYKIPKGKKEPSGIHAQISKNYFGGGEGVISLIKNNKIGKVGKGEKYCSIDEAIQNKLTAKDLVLDKVYNELYPFIMLDKKCGIKEEVYVE